MSRYIDAESFAKNILEKWRTADEKAAIEISNIIGSVVVPILIEEPNADVEKVRHGKWIMCDTNIQMAMILKCSECGRKIRVPLGNDYKKQYPYCHCGAKMDLEDETC